MKLIELMNYISTQQNKCSDAYSQLQRTATRTKVKDATTGVTEDMTPYTDEAFTIALVDYQKANENLRRARVALIQANNSVVVYDDQYTIQMAISLAKSLRDTVSTYQGILGKQATKTRRCEGNGASYFQIVELNFDSSILQKQVDQLIEQINNIESAIAQANASVEVKVELLG